jgi:hypothetical protein
MTEELSDYWSKRNQALIIENEVPRLEYGFSEGLNDELVHYIEEFVLKIPITPYKYQADYLQKRLRSLNFPDEDILISFSQPWQIKQGLRIYSIEELEKRLNAVSLEDARKDRKLAEAKGTQLLREIILQAPVSSLIVFVSPPCDQNDPQGYSMTYLGEVKKSGEIIMYACKNHLSLEGHRQFLQTLDKQDKPPEKAEDFLLSPRILQPGPPIEKIVSYLYSLDSQTPAGIEIDFKLADKRFEIIKEAIRPKIGFLINLLLEKASKQEVNSFLDEIEETAVKAYYQHFYQQKNQLILENNFDEQALEMAYRFHLLLSRQNMPIAGGSCPASQRPPGLFVSLAELASLYNQPEIQQYLESLSDENGENIRYECVGCHKIIIGKTKKCPHCGAKTCFA